MQQNKPLSLTPQLVYIALVMHKSTSPSAKAQRHPQELRIGTVWLLSVNYIRPDAWPDMTRPAAELATRDECWPGACLLRIMQSMIVLTESVCRGRQQCIVA